MWRQLSGKWIVICVALISFPVFAAINDSGVKIPWSYKGNTGPTFWGKLSPSYALCTQGREQSPIDIRKNALQLPNTLELHYQTAETSVIDDGDTRLTIKDNVTIFNDGHTIQVNFEKSKVPNFVMYQGERYDLVQFHFHSPSESQLNGQSAPLEVHFVHQGSHGKALVIAVLIKGGASNAYLQELMKHLPHVASTQQAVVIDQHEMVNPQDLFPLDNDYYSFPGSLTTPPCTEGLQWVVMAATSTATPAEIASIRTVIGGSNARAVQPLNKRVVAYSMEKAL